MVEKNVAGRRRPNNQTQSSKTSSFDKAKCLLPTKISALQFVEKCQKSRQEKICSINVTQSFFRIKMFFSSLHFSFQFKLISCVVQYLCSTFYSSVQVYFLVHTYIHIYCMYIIIQKLGIGKHPSSVACNFLTVPCQKIACENVQKT